MFYEVILQDRNRTRSSEKVSAGGSEILRWRPNFGSRHCNSIILSRPRILMMFKAVMIEQAHTMI